MTTRTNVNPGVLNAFVRARKVVRRLSPLGVAAIIVIAIVILIAIWPGLVAHQDPNRTNVLVRLRGPSWHHLFGTDELGRDLFSRAMHGIRLSLGASAAVVLISTLIGTPFGLIAGYRGGRLDTVLMRFADVLIAFPSLIMAMAIVTVLGPGLFHSMLALALVWWPQYARLARGQAMQVRTLPYVEAANALGLPHSRIAFRHVLPNILTPLLVKMSLDVSMAMLATASFSFLGLGARPPSPELGSLVTEGRDFFLSAWWYTTFPGVLILLVSLSFNIIADDLRDALDPTLRY